VDSLIVEKCDVGVNMAGVAARKGVIRRVNAPPRRVGGRGVQVSLSPVARRSRRGSGDRRVNAPPRFKRVVDDLSVLHILPVAGVTARKGVIRRVNAPPRLKRVVDDLSVLHILPVAGRLRPGKAVPGYKQLRDTKTDGLA